MLGVQSATVESAESWSAIPAKRQPAYAASNRPQCKSKGTPFKKRHLRWKPLLFLRNMLILAIIFVTLASVAMSGEKTPRMETRVVVQQGDTLWSIASRFRPDDDPRRVVDAMMQMNGLSTQTLHPGALLDLP